MDLKKVENNLDVNDTSPYSPGDKITQTKTTWWHIDKEMLRFKIHFFLFEGALGTAYPYIAVFAKNRIGLTATAFAAVLTTQQFLFIITKPLLGYIADYFNKLKAIICILTVIQTIFLFLLLPIPNINDLHTVATNKKMHFDSPLNTLNISNQYGNCQFQYETNYTSVKKEVFVHTGRTRVYCSFEDEKHKVTDNCFKVILPQTSGNLNNTLSIKYTIWNNKRNTSSSVPENSNSSTSFVDLTSICNYCCKTTENCRIIYCPDVQNISKNTPNLVHKSQFQTYQFWLFALFTTIASICLNSLFTLSDTACCESVQKTGADFGRQRLYGALGWGAMAPIGGLLNDYTDGYLTSWIVMGIMALLSLWNIYKIDLVKPHFSKNIIKDVGTVFRSREFIAFEIGVLMNGIGTGIVWFYLIWFLTTIGGNRVLCGLTQTVQCFLGEIPFFFFSGWVIKKVGHFNVLTLALMAYSIRFCWYSYLENPWFVLPMECVSGLTYGLFYAAVASYAKMSAKPGTEATTQSILFTTHEGLGAGLGCVLGGLGFDHLGGHQTFFYASIFSGCGMVLTIIFSLCNRKQKKSMTLSPSMDS